MKNDLSAEYVRSILDYNPETGIFMWKTRPISHFKKMQWMNLWNIKYSGKIAGTLNKKGYLNIYVNDIVYKAHRLAYLIMVGEWPISFIDHKDNNPSNNKWDNLRKATHSQNKINQKIYKNNTSGVKGVTFYKNRKYPWAAHVRHDGKGVFMRYFQTKEEAIYWRNYAAEYYHKEFARAA